MALKTDLSPQVVDGGDITVTIASGETDSTAIDAWGYSALGIRIPANWDTANISFLESRDGVTYHAITDYQGDVITINATSGKYIPLVANYFGGSRFLKVVSSIEQTATRTLEFALVPLYATPI